MALIIVVIGADVLLARWQWARLAVVVAALAVAASTWGRGIKVLNDYKAYENQVVSEIVSAPRQAEAARRYYANQSQIA